MRKKALGWGVAVATLLSLSLSIAFGCAPTVKSAEGPAEAAVSFDDLVSNLGALGGSGARALLPATSILKPSGQSFSTAELASFIDGIKVELANFVASRTANKPYLVLPVKLKSAGQSGLMWLPIRFGKVVSAPIIAYQHGTQVNWKCAPSRYDPNPLAILASDDVSGAFGNYVECTAAALMASAGYIVVMSDYPGFGDSRAPHPYVTLSLGESVFAMLARAQQILQGPFAAARPNGKLFLIGYSEGGFATMAAAKSLQDRHIPVTAAVPCAGSYDLAGAMVATMLSGDEVPTPYYLPYTVFGYASTYAALDPPGTWDYAAILKAPLAGRVADLFSGNYSGSYIGAQMPTTVPRQMLTDATIADLSVGAGPVYRRLAENTIFHEWAPYMLVQPIHCEYDDAVPAANTRNMYDVYSGAGLLNVLPPIWVQPVPLASLGDVHLLCYPTAMLAGFMFIATVNAM